MTIITTRDIRRRPRESVERKYDPVTTTRANAARPSNTETVTEQRPKSRGFRFLHELLPADAWADAPRVWLIGGGPSLKNFDWSLLEGEIAIGCNRCYERPNVGVAAFVDGPNAPGFLSWAELGQFGDSWRNYTGLKVYSQLTEKNDGIPEDVFVVNRSRTSGTDFDLERGLPALNNTGTFALHLAAAFGAKDIRLLGYDMNNTGDTQEHHHDGYPRKQKASVTDQMLPDVAKWAPKLESMGVKVTQYGPSRLTCFEKRPLDEAVRELTAKPDRPLVICAVTANTPYTEEVRDMVRTARAMGLSVAVEEYESRGDWTRNCHYKPVFIEKMLRKYKRPVLWLDADSRIRRYPKVFDNLKADIGWVWWDWDEIQSCALRGLELSAAVLYLRPKPDVYRMLAAWQKANTQSTSQPDQANLQAMLEGGFKQGKLKAEMLPYTYSQIFDLHRNVGAPVIEQMQASRRFRSAV